MFSRAKGKEGVILYWGGKYGRSAEGGGALLGFEEIHSLKVRSMHVKEKESKPVCIDFPGQARHCKATRRTRKISLAGGKGAGQSWPAQKHRKTGRGRKFEFWKGQGNLAYTERGESVETGKKGLSGTRRHIGAEGGRAKWTRGTYWDGNNLESQKVSKESTLVLGKRLRFLHVGGGDVYPPEAEGEDTLPIKKKCESSWGRDYKFLVL